MEGFDGDEMVKGGGFSRRHTRFPTSSPLVRAINPHARRIHEMGTSTKGIWIWIHGCSFVLLYLHKAIERAYGLFLTFTTYHIISII